MIKNEVVLVVVSPSVSDDITDDITDDTPLVTGSFNHHVDSGGAGGGGVSLVTSTFCLFNDV